MVRRHAAIALLAALAAAGCRAAGTGNLADMPQSVAPRPSLTADNVVARINQNARLVKTLRASPQISIYESDRRGVGVSGKLAMERPRNFKLTITSGVGSEEADIGSNDEGFWFWTKRDESKRFYVCSYDQDATSQLPAIFQPDWITEALGLREIPADESAAIEVEPGDGTRAGTLVLTLQKPPGDSKVAKKELVVESTTGLIRELRLYDQDKKVMASANVLTPSSGDKYRAIEILDASGQGTGQVVRIPNQVELVWAEANLKMVVDLGRSPKVNQALTASLFEEPSADFVARGYTRYDLGKELGMASGTTTVRETRPAPPAGSGVRLGRPEPAPTRSEQSLILPNDPLPLAADLGLPRASEPSEEIIGARLPTAPEPEAVRASGPHAWGRASRAGFER